MQTILDMSVAEGQFAIGYHTPLLHWFLDSFAPKTSLTSDVGGSTAIQDLCRVLSPLLVVDHGLTKVA